MNMRAKRLLLVALLPLAAHAQDAADPARDIAAIQQAAHVPAFVTQLGKQLGQSAKQTAVAQLQQTNPACGQQAPCRTKVEGLLKKIDAVTNDYFAKPQTLAEFKKKQSDAYRKHFSNDELHAIAAFLATPAGTKMLSESPLVMNESVTGLMQDAGKQLDAKLQPLVNQIKTSK
ncbi:DUF2059 domain-containing protein [Paludibacterium yongneupense]|uniref:DUF2059 domain-containing protein n=1 Tax=Paludibacterium yongneupense TaxID=400061 RepID=UPI000401B57C|nr:DUF2059 domain-containing protein [Paludibacterium yongneupense]